MQTPIAQDAGGSKVYDPGVHRFESWWETFPDFQEDCFLLSPQMEGRESSGVFLF